MKILASICVLLLTLCLAVDGQSQSASSQASYVAAPKPNVDFRLRDETTGYAVQGQITVRSTAAGHPVLFKRRTGRSGRLPVYLPDGRYLFDFSAKGYDTMDDIRYELPTTVNFGTVNLHPKNPPPELQPNVLDAQERKGYVLIHGYVVDADTGLPLSGAEVRMPKLGVETTTNARGYFAQSVLMPVVGTPTPQEPGTVDDLIVSLAGYKIYALTNTLLPNEGWQRFVVELQKGSGKENHDNTPTPLQDPATVPPTHGSLPENLAPDVAPAEIALQSVAAATPIALPTNITVGLSCPTQPCSNNPNQQCPICNQQCAVAQPFKLESYVQQGLQREWQSNWATDSLKAGAVAYRTYGEYFVQHPGRSGSSNYDIRSDTRNQAFVATKNPANSTAAAASATAGVALTADGTTAFFSEYAANTTGFGTCLNGQTGDGSSNWPCMWDPIAAGSTGSGHGRGMSQWGSEWWATGDQVTSPRGWQCIVDHYYNDNGNTTFEERGLRTSFIGGPGGDGPVAYLRTSRGASDVYSVNIDGSGQSQLTRTGSNDHPAWQPGGAKISFRSTTQSYLMNPDGTGATAFTTDYVWSWSPMADKYASYAGVPLGDTQIFVTNANGSGRTQVTSISNCSGSALRCDNVDPSWSPDGSKIAFDSNRMTPRSTISSSRFT